MINEEDEDDDEDDDDEGDYGQEGNDGVGADANMLMMIRNPYTHINNNHGMSAHKPQRPAFQTPAMQKEGVIEKVI